MTERRRPLWGAFGVRVFICLLIFVALSQALFIAVLYLERGGRRDRQNWGDKFFSENIRPLMTGLNLDEARGALLFYNLWGHCLWYEGPEGQVVAGEAYPGLSREERRKLPPPVEFDSGARIWSATLAWQGRAASDVDLFMAPLHLKDGVFNFCYVYDNPKLVFLSGRDVSLGLMDRPFVERGVGKSILIFIALSAVMSFFFARLFAGPLKALQAKVAHINENDLNQDIDIRRPNEVAEVARAVNELKNSLYHHITGMRMLLANVSHEIRSPLMRMSLSFSFLEDAFDEARERLKEARARGCLPPEDPEIQAAEETGPSKLALGEKYLGYLKEELGHMERLVGNTLLSSKLDLGGFKAEDLKLMDFSKLCREALETQQALASIRQLGLSAAIEDGIRLKSDEVLARPLVFNLLDNAVKYGLEGTVINVGLSRDPAGRGTLFSVDNESRPLPQEALSHLFDPFYRGGRACGQGAGLGLYLVKQIVGLHGGEIGLRQEGRRLYVEVLLPEAET